MTTALDRTDFRAVLGRERLLPVVVVDAARDAPPLAEALRDGGLGLVEVTLRTPAALDAIDRIREAPGMRVGAGTVLDASQVAAAYAAGAGFIVSPGLERDVVEAARALGLPVVPGIATATELMAARRLGLDLVKFFPAAALGGVDALRGLASLAPTIGFVPTGGVTELNLADYLGVPDVVACGGTWIAPRDLIAAGRFGEIARRARVARDIAHTTA